MVYRVVEKASAKLDKEKKGPIYKTVQETALPRHAAAKRSAALGKSAKIERAHHKATVSKMANAKVANAAPPGGTASASVVKPVIERCDPISGQQKRLSTEIHSILSQMTEKYPTKGCNDAKEATNSKPKVISATNKCSAKPPSAADAQRRAALRAIQFLASHSDNEKVVEKATVKRSNVSSLQREKVGTSARLPQSRIKVANPTKIDANIKVENRVAIAADGPGDEVKARRLPLSSERVKSLSRMKVSSVSIQSKQRAIAKEKGKNRVKPENVNVTMPPSDKKQTSTSPDFQFVNPDEPIDLTNFCVCASNANDKADGCEMPVQSFVSLQSGSFHPTIPNSTAEKVILVEDLSPLMSGGGSLSPHLLSNAEREIPILDLDMKMDGALLHVEVLENGQGEANHINSDAELASPLTEETSASPDKADPSLGIVETPKLSFVSLETSPISPIGDKIEETESSKVMEVQLSSEPISDTKVTSLIMQDDQQKCCSAETLPVFSIKAEEENPSKSSKSYFKNSVNNLGKPSLKAPMNHNVVALDISGVKANSYFETSSSRGPRSNYGVPHSPSIFALVQRPQFVEWGQQHIDFSVDPEIPVRRNYTECIPSRQRVQQQIWDKSSSSNDPDRILNAITDKGNESIREYIHRIFFEKRIEMSFSHDRGRKLFVEYCAELWKQRKSNWEAEYRRNYDRAMHGLPNGFHILRSNAQGQVLYSSSSVPIGSFIKRV